ncbi:hypothetical protein CEXT_800091 [Caerostris extrusa]|uniref:Uncharacterized protein n=1 Tax=Caerostris extrusa TaxID=172846 RepID=A0AAV4ULT7_CAEEX|nr:hypothetical protein CEXT_800091 [Caerostris extrusa]
MAERSPGSRDRTGKGYGGGGEFPINKFGKIQDPIKLFLRSFLLLQIPVLIPITVPTIRHKSITIHLNLNTPLQQVRNNQTFKSKSSFLIGKRFNYLKTRVNRIGREDGGGSAPQSFRDNRLTIDAQLMPFTRCAIGPKVVILPPFFLLPEPPNPCEAELTREPLINLINLELQSSLLIGKRFNYLQDRVDRICNEDEGEVGMNSRSGDP